MSAMASQITSLNIVYLTVYSGADQRKQQSSASLAFVREIHRWPVNSPHKGPVTLKMFPFDDVIMLLNKGNSDLFHFQCMRSTYITTCWRWFPWRWYVSGVQFTTTRWLEHSVKIDKMLDNSTSLRLHHILLFTKTKKQLMINPPKSATIIKYGRIQDVYQYIL